MTRTVLLFVLLGLGAVLVGCKTKPTEDPCLTSCQLHAKELKCEHPELCAENCQKVKTASACKKPMDAFMACALKRPKEDYECSGAGIPVLQHRACEAEQDDMLLCLQKSNGKL